ncbi:MAG: J domain-containing protein [Candidatus Sericytochromatia bacterium]
MARRPPSARQLRDQKRLERFLETHPQLNAEVIREYDTLAMLMLRAQPDEVVIRQLRLLLERQSAEQILINLGHFDTQGLTELHRQRFAREIQRLLEMNSGEREAYLQQQESWKLPLEMSESWQGPLGLFRESDESLSALAVLELAPPCGPREIRRAFRHKARRAHPDKGGQTEAFIHLQQAYRTALANCF